MAAGFVDLCALADGEVGRGPSLDVLKLGGGPTLYLVDLTFDETDPKRAHGTSTASCIQKRTSRCGSTRPADLAACRWPSWTEIRAKRDCSDSYTDQWSKRFESDRVAGLLARHAGGERYHVTDRLEARVLARTTKHKPADSSTHWSSGKLAAELGGDITHMTVARVGAKRGIKPHLLEGYLTSNDPDFETREARNTPGTCRPGGAPHELAYIIGQPYRRCTFSAIGKCSAAWRTGNMAECGAQALRLILTSLAHFTRRTPPYNVGTRRVDTGGWPTELDPMTLQRREASR